MGVQLVVFLIFLALACVFHYGEKRFSRARVCATSAKWVCITASILTHPVTWASIHEFTIHALIYSGTILPKL